ncbi:MAG: hypothetical protein PUD59_05500 [bacterium]|nr:hypothetical protein [bacterium]
MENFFKLNKNSKYNNKKIKIEKNHNKKKGLVSILVLVSFFLGTVSINIVNIFEDRLKIESTKLVFDIDNEFVNNSNKLIDEFNKAVDSNYNFSDLESRITKISCNKLLNDWGYLYDNDEDFENLIYIISNLDIIRNQIFNENISGCYTLSNEIKVSNQDCLLSDASVFNHELIHAVSNHGLTIGTLGCITFGKGFNEGISESIKRKYGINGYNTYDNAIIDTFKLSILIGKENIMKSFLVDSIYYLVKSIKDCCNNIKITDILKYIYMIDEETNSYKNGIKLNDNFFKEKDELYNKLYKSVYKKNFNNLNIVNCNFLDDKVTIEIDNKKYCIPVSKYNEINFNNISEYEMYCTIESEDLNNNYLIFLMDEEEKIKYKSNTKKCIDNLLYKYKSMEDEKYNKFINILNGINGTTVSDYVNLIIDVLDNKNLDKYEYVSELREFESIVSYSNYNCDDIKKLINREIINELNKRNYEDLLFLYESTDICYVIYDYYNRNNCIISNTYNEFVEIDNYRIFNNRIVVDLDDEYSIYKVNCNDELLEMHKVNDSISSFFKTLFKTDNSNFYMSSEEICISELYDVEIIAKQQKTINENKVKIKSYN